MGSGWDDMRCTDILWKVLNSCCRMLWVSLDQKWPVAWVIPLRAWYLVSPSAPSNLSEEVSLKACEQDTTVNIRGDSVLQVFNCQLSLGIALLGMCFIWEHKYFGMLGDGNDGENHAVQYFSMLGRPMATSSNKSTLSAGHPPSLRAGRKLSKRHCIMRANWFIMLHLQSVQELRHEMLGIARPS